MPGIKRVGITGHQGLTSATEVLVREAIEELLSSTAQLVGITSLAEGADQIFAEQVLRKNGKLQVVIPASDYESTFDSRTLITYRDLLAQASEVYRLEFEESTEEAFWAAGQWVVDHVDLMVAVWNGEEAGGLGGTADVVKYSETRRVPVAVVWPAGAQRK